MTQNRSTPHRPTNGTADSNDTRPEPLVGESVLRAVMEGTSTTSGKAFFPAIVENLARALDMRVATIGLIDPETEEFVDTLAMWDHSALQENTRYELAGTPCENVMGGKTCLHLDDVQAQFPEDEMLREMGIRCYVGTPLRTADGKNLGVLNVLDNRPMDPDRTAVATAVLEIFASRAVTELDRIGAHQALIDHKLQLEELVKRRTAALRESQDRLVRSERLASLGTLAAGIAHEINNPLGIIRLATDSLRLDAGNHDAATRTADLIVDNVERCRLIIQSVLRFARSEPSEKTWLDANDCIRMAIDASRADAAHAGVQIRGILGDDLPHVMANETELQQVFVNLIGNAVISAGVSQIKIQSSVENGCFCVLVQDDGAGIADADLPFVFDPFFTTRQHAGGTGLGLSICHGIVRDHGGDIEILQPDTGGCTFRVELPMLSNTRG